jgi:hypothetical protein
MTACSGHAQNTRQAMAQMSQTKICVCRRFVAEYIGNRSGKFGLDTYTLPQKERFRYFSSLFDS